MKKKIILLLMTAVISCSLLGCGEEYIIDVDTETDVMAVDTTTGKPSLHQELDVKDEDFKLVCDYDTGNYSLDNWHVTDCKDVGMSVHTQGLPNGYEVVIDHVHADISLMSTSAQINGITQDSMDDTCHGQNQDGFYISDTDEYYNIFSIEGYTNQFYEIWGNSYGEFGSINSSYQRLTESNIIQSGTYAEKLSIVYDLSIKKPNSDKYYTKSVKSAISIPINKTIKYKDIDGNVREEIGRAHV